MTRTNNIRMFVIASLAAVSGAVFFSASASAGKILNSGCDGNGTKASSQLETRQNGGRCFDKRQYKTYIELINEGSEDSGRGSRGGRNKR
jgi:hypothetical protein